VLKGSKKSSPIWWFKEISMDVNHVHCNNLANESSVASLFFCFRKYLFQNDVDIQVNNYYLDFFFGYI